MLDRTGVYMATITKIEIVKRVSKLTGQQKIVVAEVVQEFLGRIAEELGKGNRLEFREFGVFKTAVRKARIGINPKTLVRVNVPAKRTVKFKAGRKMKQIVTENQVRGVRSQRRR